MYYFYEFLTFSFIISDSKGYVDSATGSVKTSVKTECPDDFDSLLQQARAGIVRK